MKKNIIAALLVSAVLSLSAHAEKVEFNGVIEEPKIASENIEPEKEAGLWDRTKDLAGDIYDSGREIVIDEVKSGKENIKAVGDYVEETYKSLKSEYSESQEEIVPPPAPEPSEK